MEQTHTTRLRRTSDQPRFLCVGQLIGRKGIDALLRGLGALLDEGLRCSLTLLGSGPEREHLQRLAATLGLEDVHFVGEQRPESVGGSYAEADCVIFPTMEDVWGLVVNEAILAGVPVLCSIYAGCVDELVPSDYRFDPRDPESVKQALRRAFRGQVKPIPKSVLRTPDSVAQDIIAAIEAELTPRRSRTK
jgi:glycosyltransferase involved in cell wall biosynthesis